MFLSRQHFITLAPSSPARPGISLGIEELPRQPHENPNRQRHGIQTKGKRSPDGKLLEYAYTRELARQIVKILQSRDYDSELLVPEDDDIPLSERVRRTNAHCQALGKSNVILISLHLNAASAGTKWMNPTGWSCYTCKGQTESDRLTDCLYKAAEQNRQAGYHRYTRRRD